MWVNGILLIYVMPRYHIIEIICTYTLNLKNIQCVILYEVLKLQWLHVKILVSIVIMSSIFNQPVNIFTLIIHQFGFIIIYQFSI